MANYPSSQNTDDNLYVAVNNLSTVLTDNPLAVGATTVNVASTTNFPSVGILTIDLEAIHYTGKTATSFTGCTRGFDGTTDAEHAQNATVFHDIPAAHHNVLKDEIKAVSDDLRDAFTGDLDDAVTPAASATDVKERLDHIVTQLKNLSGKTDWKTAPADTLEGLSTELVAIQSDLDDSVTPVASAADLETRLDHIATQLKTITGEADWKTAPDVDLATTDLELEALKQNIPNLLVNGGMEVWQRGTSFSSLSQGDYTADKWSVSFSAATSPTWTISREATEVDNEKYSLKSVITDLDGATSALLLQDIENWESYKGKTVSLSVRVKSNQGVVAAITDGVAGTFSTAHTGDNTWQTLTVTEDVSTSATRLSIYIYFGRSPATTGTTYIDSVMLVNSDTTVDYVPEDKQIELARCQRYYEDTTTNIRYAALGISDGTNYYNEIPIQYHVEKQSTPTVTVTVTRVQEEGSTTDQKASYSTALADGSSHGFNMAVYKAIAGNKPTDVRFTFSASV